MRCLLIGILTLAVLLRCMTATICWRWPASARLRSVSEAVLVLERVGRLRGADFIVARRVRVSHAVVVVLVLVLHHVRGLVKGCLFVGSVNGIESCVLSWLRAVRGHLASKYESGLSRRSAGGVVTILRAAHGL